MKPLRLTLVRLPRLRQASPKQIIKRPRVYRHMLMDPHRMVCSQGDVACNLQERTRCWKHRLDSDTCDKILGTRPMHLGVLAVKDSSPG